MPAKSEIVTVADAAKIIGVSKSRMRQWIMEGRIKVAARYGQADFLTKNAVSRLKRQPAGRPKKSSKLMLANT